MHTDWTTFIAQILFYVVAALTAASLFRDPKSTGSALIGTLLYVPATFCCFIAIAFTRPRRALPKFGGKASRSVGHLLHECGLTFKWLVQLAMRPLTGHAGRVKKARPSELGREESGGNL